MDFLDPRKKRHYRTRLIFGYILITIAICLGAVVLVYGAYGYSINTKTGQIIQNGLLFVGSKPAADIYLNDKPQHSTTSARLILPAGNYQLALKKAGYRNWERQFTLEEHNIIRFIYPFLVPTKPVANTVKVYSSQPSVITQSPDLHWILVEAPGVNAATINFDEYDTGDFAEPKQVISLPVNLLTNIELPGSSFKAVEWSTDNNHLLLKHTYQGGSEFIILDRNSPADSININSLFNTAPTEVALRNKKADQLYIYDQAKATLRLGDVSRGTLGPVLLSHVLAFKDHGSNLLTYVSDKNVAAGKVQARFWDNGNTYPLYTFNKGAHYLIDAAQFQGHWYYIAGSDTTEKVNLYKDPLSKLKDPSVAKAIPQLAFRALGATNVSFSANTRFVGVEAGQKFGVYDMELQERYQYTLQIPLSGPLHWMDGHRWLGASGGATLMMDYDSTNPQTLVPTADVSGGYFSRNYNQLFVLAPLAESGGATVFQVVDMRAGTDLPKP